MAAVCFSWERLGLVAHQLLYLYVLALEYMVFGRERPVLGRMLGR